MHKMQNFPAQQPICGGVVATLEQCM